MRMSLWKWKRIGTCDRLGIAVLLLSLTLGLASAASATPLDLTEATADGTAPGFVGSVEFDVNGSNLLVTVRNESHADPYSIYAVLFNASSDVRNLTLQGVSQGYSSPSGWVSYDSGYYVSALAFGDFDYSVWQWNHTPIAPGSTYVFAFTVDCEPGQTCDKQDFLGSTSDGVAAYAAARWSSTRHALFAGATTVSVPEPRRWLLFAMLAPFVAVVSHRRRSLSA